MLLHNLTQPLLRHLAMLWAWAARAISPGMTPPARNWKTALLRGFARRCPACDQGAMFKGYITTHDACPHCGEALHHHRADDAPPYLTIFIVGHIVVPLVLVLEKLWPPPLWVHFAAWLPATLLLTLWFLPRVKGATVGLQWALGMHGFDGKGEGEPPPRPKTLAP